MGRPVVYAEKWACAQTRTSVQNAIKAGARGASWHSAGHLLTADSKCSKITCGVGASKCKKCKSPEQSSANEACLVNRLQSQKHAAKDQCEECHEGFELTADFKCTPFTCTTGSDAGCAVCRSHGLILMSASPGC